MPSLTAASRVEFERDGVRATRATLGEHEVTLLAFPPGFRLPAFDIDRPYVATVLRGSLVKTFARSECALGPDSLVTLPRDATHATDFGKTTTTVVVVRAGADEASPALAPIVRRQRHVRAAVTSTLGWRLAVELRARDAAWALAAEGLVLQLLATAGRVDVDTQVARVGWLGEARELLHESVPGAGTSLSGLAEAVGVHPSHLARAFRREYGLTVGEYVRALRLEWATAQLALDEASLADIAARAGFADQSHFTRAFRRHTGVTPGRYRELVRR
jgi:AraC family transcriptional regulator